MTEEYKASAEFIAREPRTDSSEPIEVDNRDHIRLSLRDSSEELSQACDGISVKLHKKGWFLMEEIGIANIKDISLSGVGLITPATLKLNQVIWVEVKQSFFAFTIMRQYPVNQRLNFIGGKWKSSVQDKINKLLIEINNLKSQ
ncbi:hypothetical protein LMH66_17325 [Shewanella sp. 10N.7]|uniref:hypothetical protein n=1 Tax=Shewanella sp. 10N.7 TaxID=2885093 RepID=UPI001E61A031|nr:hypothetical protein [Shewanella sp. 10N.7]MCC4834411.1 hypothetical protein [Shewanella sp. 10N.7]